MGALWAICLTMDGAGDRFLAVVTKVVAEQHNRDAKGLAMATPPPPPPAGGAGAYPDNSKGTVALVTGILGLFVCPIILSIIAIVFGRQGLDAAARGTANNAGMAKAGWVLGIVGLVLGIIGVIFYIIFGVVAVSQS